MHKHIDFLRRFSPVLDKQRNPILDAEGKIKSLSLRVENFSLRTGTLDRLYQLFLPALPQTAEAIHALREVQENQKVNRKITEHDNTTRIVAHCEAHVKTRVDFAADPQRRVFDVTFTVPRKLFFRLAASHHFNISGKFDLSKTSPYLKEWEEAKAEAKASRPRQSRGRER